jgi:hypothetical protein
MSVSLSSPMIQLLLLEPVVQHWVSLEQLPGINNICARMTSDTTPDQIYTTTTYVMWHEEHFWNLNVHQRVHFPILFHMSYSHIKFVRYNLNF